MSEQDDLRESRRLFAALSATLADELRQPLNMAQLALENAQRALAQAHRRRQMLATIGGALNGPMSPEPQQPHNLGEVLANLPSGGVTLDVPPKLWLLAIPGALDVVLGNLLDIGRNRGASPRLSGERLDSLPASLPPSVTLKPPIVRIYLSDDGESLPEAVASRLFRVSARQAGQLGANLWLARKVVRLHGGDLWLARRDRGLRLVSLWPHTGEPGFASIAVDGWPIGREEFGRTLREERERRGLTRFQASAQTGVSDSTWRNVETGRHQVSKSTRIRMLALFK